MTEPTEPTGADTPAADAAPTADLPPTPPASGPAQAETASHPMPGPVPPQPFPYAATPAPYPFAPVVKEPWFNPAKRTTILASAVVAAVVLLGGGVLIGLAAHHDRRDRPGITVYGPGGYGRVIVPGDKIAPGFVVPGHKFPGNGQGHVKRQPGQVPSPSPSGSSTTS